MTRTSKGTSSAGRRGTSLSWEFKRVLVLAPGRFDEPVVLVDAEADTAVPSEAGEGVMEEGPRLFNDNMDREDIAVAVVSVVVRVRARSERCDRVERACCLDGEAASVSLDKAADVIDRSPPATVAVGLEESPYVHSGPSGILGP